MPTCFITLSEVVSTLDDQQLDLLRDIVAEELSSESRVLDRNHVSLRVLRSTRSHMLAELELEIFCQFFFRRFLTRDKRAQKISLRSTRLIGTGCATWINMAIVGYSRATIDGQVFFSDKSSDARNTHNS